MSSVHPESLRTEEPVSDDGRRVIEVLAAVVEPLRNSLGPLSEVVLHEVGRERNRIIAISGTLTGRRVGDPTTDLLTEQERLADGSLSRADYVTVLDDGRRLRSSTMIMRDNEGAPVAALCINTDVTAWVDLQQRIGTLVSGHVAAEAVDLAASAPIDVAPERTPQSVDGLVSELIETAIRRTGVPVELMKKRHKLAVVDELEARGLFLLKDAVEVIATSLEVSRFTIYNYLNELGGTDEAASSGDTR